MKNYNYFLDSQEAFQYFRQPFRAKGYFCETRMTEPYLEEIPIAVLIKIPTEDSSNSELLQITAKLKCKNAPNREEICSIPTNQVSFQEDILSYQDNINFITIQALNQDEIYLVWERMEERKKIFFNGKMSSAPISLWKKMTSGLF
ncbi:MAG: hypothetical protein JJT78_13760 [Leptospira sp.]|nr:hypothetical protein [Leptospira sp.]